MLYNVFLLTGGEKARVALASFMLIPRNLLLLDEPTNHLDEITIEVLSKALCEYDGAIIAISHNGKFLDSLKPTHVFKVTDGKVDIETCAVHDEDDDDNDREFD